MAGPSCRLCNHKDASKLNSVHWLVQAAGPCCACLTCPMVSSLCPISRLHSCQLLQGQGGGAAAAEFSSGTRASLGATCGHPACALCINCLMPGTITWHSMSVTSTGSVRLRHTTACTASPSW